MAKRILLLTVLAGLVFCACNKDNNEEASIAQVNRNNSPKHLAKLTVIDDRGERLMSIRLDWTEDNLQHIYVTERSYLMYEVTLEHNTNNINRAFIYDYDDQSGKMMDFNYSAGALTSITSPNFDGISFQYAGNVPTYIVSSDTRLSMIWQDGNIRRLTSYGDFDVSDILYDNNYNPLNDLFSNIFPGWNVSVNNPIKLVSNNKVVNIIYEFSGGYPTLATISNNDGFAKIYYQYSDGSGVVPPTDGQKTIIRSRDSRYTFLPSAITR